MAISNLARFDAYRIVAFGSLTTSYTVLGTPLAHSTRILKFVNTTDADVSISFDGTTNNDYIPAGGFSLYDVTSDAGSDGQFSIQKNTQLYVKQMSASTKGSVVVICVYARGE
jgi:hypothetical protein